MLKHFKSRSMHYYAPVLVCLLVIVILLLTWLNFSTVALI